MAQLALCVQRYGWGREVHPDAIVPRLPPVFPPLQLKAFAPEGHCRYEISTLHFHQLHRNGIFLTQLPLT